MTDPITELERQLVAAARRRNSTRGGAQWRWLPPRPSALLPVTALAVALVAVVLIGVTGRESETPATSADRAAPGATPVAAAECASAPPPLNATDGPLPEGALAALPALGGEPTDALPRGADPFLREFRARRVWREAARRLGRRAGVDYWAIVMADARQCEDGKAVAYARPWHACLLALREGEVATHFCNGPDDQGRLTGHSIGEDGDRLHILGFAPPRAKEAIIRFRRGEERIPASSGYFAGRLSGRFAFDDAAEPPRVEFSPN